MGRFSPKGIALPRYESGVPGLPARAMAFTNSEVGTTNCKLKWWFSYGNRFGSGQNSAMYFGSQMHEVLEDIFDWWRLNDTAYLPEYLWEKPSCNPFDLNGSGTKPGVLKRILQEMEEQGAGEHVDDIEAFVSRLYDCAYGYLRTYGTILKDYKVIGVELPTAMPVRNTKTGKQFYSLVPIAETPDGWGLALPGQKYKEVRLPWFKVGRLDCIVMEKRTGDLWVWEFKTSKSAQTYGKNLALDTQLPGYALSLQAALNTKDYRSLFPKECSGVVRGYIWDVLGSNEHKVPRRLKSGKLSTAAQKVPSWVWHSILETEQADRHKYTQEEWEKLLAMPDEAARHVDPFLYHREWDVFNDVDLARYESELHSKARLISQMRRALVRSGNTAWDKGVAGNFDRTPICRMPGGYCNYTSLCMNDSEATRLSFTQEIPTLWPSGKVPVPTKPDEENKWQI